MLGNKIMIQVTMDMQTGAIQVTGPINEKAIVCKILGLGIAAVVDHVVPAIIDQKNGNGNGLIKH